jgi:hypothetical protein
MPTTCRRLHYRLRVFTVKESHAALLPSSLLEGYRLRVFTVKEAQAALYPSSIQEKNVLRIKVTRIEK